MFNIFDIVQHYNVGTYNYYFELASLIFLVVLIIRYFSKKRFVSSINTIFGIGLVAAFFDICLDIIGAISLEKLTGSSIGFSWLVNNAFYFFQVFFAFIMFVYVMYNCGMSFKANKGFIIFAIPAITVALLILTNNFTHLIVYFEENADGVYEYKHGSLFILMYIVTFFYLLLSLGFNLCFRKTIQKKQYITIYYVFIMVFLVVVVQIIFPSILLTGVGITLALMCVYQSLENPDFMSDKISGTFNYNALIGFIDHQFEKLNRQKHILKHTKEETKQKINLLIININGISAINHSHGLKFANALYNDIGTFFNSIQTESPKWVFRVFNSKFLLYFSNKDDLDVAVENIKLRFEDKWNVAEDNYKLKYNLLIFSVESNLFENSSDLLDFCNSIDGEIKKDGIKYFFYVDDEIIKVMQRKKEVRMALERAFKSSSSFYMNYQPIMNMRTGKFSEAEALLRLKDEKLGFISPAEFIPIAESSGMASKIDKRVFTMCCEFLKRHPEVDHIDINVSGAEFFNNPAEKFIKILEKNRVSPKRICFEITETAAVQNPEKVSEFMSEFLELGAQFAMDDFGTGYSNISEIMKRTFNAVKLDKTLLSRDEKIKSFLRVITILFKEINVPVVIEGVENESDLDYIKSLGIDYVQGFYYSKPLSEDDFIQFLKINA